MKIFNRLLDWYFAKNALPYWCILLLDMLICYMSGIFVFWLYYHGAVTMEHFWILTKTIFVYMIFNLIGFRMFRTYSGIIRYSSFVDLQRVGMAMAVSCVVAELFHYAIYPYHTTIKFVPLEGRQILAMYVIATILMWGVRVLVKSLYDVIFSNGSGYRTLIYGVHEGGVGLAKNIRNMKPSPFQLKGFISNDAHYEDHLLMGTRVYEVNDQLPRILKEKRIQAVLVSPIQNDRFRNDEQLQNLLIENGIKIFMTQGTREVSDKEDIVNGTMDLKEVSVEDLLPREQIEVDMKSIGTLLCGRKILISGSAGSIGSEMVRQIAKFGPAELILIDQAETPQHDIRLMMNREWPQIKVQTIVASITHAAHMEYVFSTCRPDYVFHAAAYKHVPMMEDNPGESIYNNVYGTKVLADLSVKYGVRKFVMISTDKAVNPTNVMGCSKRICEIYVQSLNNQIRQQTGESGNSQNTSSVTQFVTTRFGNVLGSNGSVIPLFEKQIKEGGPVTVTDERITRFFMLIPEACKLVLEAGTHGHGGEIFVFDMGKPVRIAELAKRMIKLSGRKNVDIVYTGLREGEKLYEEVLSNTENTLPSFHEKIRIAQVREYDFHEISESIDELLELAKSYDEMQIVKKMKEIVPEYISNNSKYSVLDKEK